MQEWQRRIILCLRHLRMQVQVFLLMILEADIHHSVQLQSMILTYLSWIWVLTERLERTARLAV